MPVKFSSKQGLLNLFNFITSIDEDAPEVERNKCYAASAILWQHTDTLLFVIEKQDEKYWRSAIAIYYFVDKGRFKNYKKLLNITAKKPTLVDFCKALGDGFGKTYIRDIANAGCIFATLLQQKWRFKELPGNIEVATKINAICKKNKDYSLASGLWRCVMDKNNNNAKGINLPIFMKAIEREFEVELSKLKAKPKEVNEPAIPPAQDLQKLTITAPETIESLK